jgi:hypothetical protein
MGRVDGATIPFGKVNARMSRCERQRHRGSTIRGGRTLRIQRLAEFHLTRILNSEYAVKVGPGGDHRVVLRNLFRSLQPPHRWAHSPTVGGCPLHRQRERSRFRKAQTSLIGVAMSAEPFADSPRRRQRT